jgi:tetratricopeptide (TPR) repeat protein
VSIRRPSRASVLVPGAAAVAVLAAVAPVLGVEHWWWAPVSAGGAAVLAFVGISLNARLEVERASSLNRRQAELERGAGVKDMLAAQHGLRRNLPRVSECDARRLGVHASIADEAGEPGSGLPTYVPRDTDAQLRAALQAAAVQGGLIVLIGRSSTGKSRSAYEAVREVLGGWRLWQPDDAASVTRAAGGPMILRQTVVWLDEMQRFLDGPAGLVAGPVRRLLSADDPVVIVGTIWPDRYLLMTAEPIRDQGGQVIEDRFAHEREVLDLAEIVDIDDRLSSAERKRAQLIAKIDPRVAAALKPADYGMTQVLAAAPDLVRRWEHALPYARAVITAAVDARRLGTDAPLTLAFFRGAVPGYLRADQIAGASDDWLEEGLRYCVEKVRGAAAVLSPVGHDMGHAAGYKIAEYLVQYGDSVRHTAGPPDTFWRALSDLAGQPDDQARLGNAAESRGLLDYAEGFYRTAITQGDGSANVRLASLVGARGRDEEAVELLRAAIAAAVPFATRGLVDLLEFQGRDDEAVRVLSTGSLESASLTRWRLALLLERLGRYEEAEETWREGVAAGDPDARWRLAVLLERLHRYDEAERILRLAVADGEEGSRRRLSILLERLGRTQELERALRDSVEVGEPAARQRLIELLDRLGRAGEAEAIRQLGQAPGPTVSEAAPQLDDLSRRVGRKPHADEPRPARPAAPPPTPDAEIAAALRQATDGTDPYSWRRLAFLLERHGRAEDARNLRRHGLGAGGIGTEPWWSHRPRCDDEAESPG